MAQNSELQQNQADVVDDPSNPYFTVDVRWRSPERPIWVAFGEAIQTLMIMALAVLVNVLAGTYDVARNELKSHYTWQVLGVLFGTVVLVTMATAIVGWVRRQSENVQEFQNRLSAVYLAALDRSPLNPDRVPPLELPDGRG
jgi:hypothetical protein